MRDKDYYVQGKDVPEDGMVSECTYVRLSTILCTLVNIKIGYQCISQLTYEFYTEL